MVTALDSLISALITLSFHLLYREMYLKLLAFLFLDSLFLSYCSAIDLVSLTLALIEIPTFLKVLDFHLWLINLLLFHFPLNL
jgi:hypothetical protein